MKLPKYLTTVTPFSKLLAAILFILFPILSFGLGVKYQQSADLINKNVLTSTTLNPTLGYAISPTSGNNRTEAIILQYVSKEKVSGDVDANLLTGEYITIPGVNLEIKIPSTYLLQQNKTRSVIESNMFYKKDLGENSDDIRIPSFFVGTVLTDLTPQQWLAENVSYQGQKWDNSMGTGKNININDLDIFSVGVSCCGGYQQLYIYKTKSVDEQNIFVVVGTNDIFADYDYGTENRAKGINSDRNVILDKITSTLRSSN